MDMTVARRRGTIEVGPPGGPTVKIPAGFSISVRNAEIYDLDLEVSWDQSGGRHTLKQLTIGALPDGEYVRMSKINLLALSDIISTALESDVLGEAGWAQLVDDHAEHDPTAVDALIYLMACALGGQKPSATVAIARGLSPATGPKHVARARAEGLLPPAEPGKASSS